MLGIMKLYAAALATTTTTTPTTGVSHAD